MCSINIAVPTAVPLLTTERGYSGHFPDKKQLEERKEGSPLAHTSEVQPLMVDKHCNRSIHGQEETDRCWRLGYLLLCIQPRPRPVACMLLLTFRAEPSIPSNTI